MARAFTFVHDIYALEFARVAVVLTCALSLIAAGLAGVYLAAPYILSLRSAAGLPG